MSNPTFVLINKKEEIIERWEGYGKSQYLKNMKEALRDLTPLNIKRARYQRNPSAEDAAALGRYAQSQWKYDDAVEFFKAAKKLSKEGSSNYSFEIFDNIIKTLAPLPQVEQAANAVLNLKEQSRENIINVVQRMSRLLLLRGHIELIEPYLEAGFNAIDISSNPELEKVYRQLLELQIKVESNN